MCTRRRFRANSPIMRSLLLVVLEVTTAISLETTAGVVAIVEVGSGPKRNGGGRAVPEVNDVIKVLK